MTDFKTKQGMEYKTVSKERKVLDFHQDFSTRFFELPRKQILMLKEMFLEEKYQEK